MPSPTSKTLRFSANPNKSTTEDLGDTRDGCVPSRVDMFGQLAVLCTNEELGKARKSGLQYLLLMLSRVRKKI